MKKGDDLLMKAKKQAEESIRYTMSSYNSEYISKRKYEERSNPGVQGASNYNKLVDIKNDIIDLANDVRMILEEIKQIRENL